MGTSFLSKRVIAVGLFLQLLIVSLYINRKLTISIAVTQPANRLHSSLKLTDDGKQDSSVFGKRQKSRVHRIREYCANFKSKLTKEYPEYERLKDVLPRWNWIVSPYHKLFYCATPKCASTTWKAYIMEDLGMKWTMDTHV